MSMQSQPTRATPVVLRAAVLVVGGAALLSACTSGTSGGGSGNTAAPAASHASSASTGPTASAATCKHVASLRTSLENLTRLRLNASASQQIRTDLSNIQAQLTALKTEGSGTLSPQVSQLSAALHQVKKAANGLSANPSASQVQAIITALGGLKSTSQATIADMKALCPHA